MKKYCRTFDNETLGEAIYYFTKDLCEHIEDNDLINISFTETFAEVYMHEYFAFIQQVFDILEAKYNKNLEDMKLIALKKYIKAYTWYMYDEGDKYSMIDAFLYLTRLYMCITDPSFL